MPIGFGGCEHAIGKKLLASKVIEKVFAVSGNDGMILDGLARVDILISEHSSLVDFAKKQCRLDFYGYSDALTAGIVDDFQAADLKGVSLTNTVAELEWSKDFSKYIMSKYHTNQNTEG